MERLKIAHITPYYYPSIGGVSTQAQYIAEGLVERGHYVDVITAHKDHSSRPPLKAPKREIINNVNIFRYKSILNIGHMSLMPGLITHFLHNKYDVLHYHVYRHPLTDISSLFGRINSSVNVLQGQGPFFEPGELGLKKAFLYSLYDSVSRFFVLNFSDIILALNDYEKERFKLIFKR